MIFEIFVISGSPASAGLFGGGPSAGGGPHIQMASPSEAATQLEQRYHVNTEAVQEQGESLNVADTKKFTPEVSLFFSPTDPKPGEKITARAFPSYFTNDASKLYFTWYLMRDGCWWGGSGGPRCDLDGNGSVTPNDWMIEAHRILASNDLDLTNVVYVGPGGTPSLSSDQDNDGYAARFGGDNRVRTPDHCYYHDSWSGENYELIEDYRGNVDWNCPGGTQPVCMVGSATVTPGAVNVSAVGDASGGSASASGETFVLNDSNDYISGTPYCNSSGTVGCNVGTPCCVSNPATATACSSSLSSCSRPGGSGRREVNPICRHLFPVTPGLGSQPGDGSFTNEEERFWSTSPTDPDTADNGNKDEANVIGLGRDTFTWNYLPGDRVGVVVEGTAMIATKYKDSSKMIMWAFSKNTCPDYGQKGSYTQSIAGYQVVIPTIAMDLRDCVAWNTVDPTEGGQATNLELSVVASPDDPINDVTTRSDGDQLNVTATIDNSAKGIQGVYYDWRVELSPDGTANPRGGWINVTSALNNLPDSRKLLSPVRGNGVNQVQLELNMRSTDVFNGRTLASYLLNDIGYLRFRVEAAENYGAIQPSSASGASRRGRSSVIVKFNASQDRIIAHTVLAAGDPAHVSLANNEICSGIVNPGDPAEQQALSRLDGKLCRVIKNEIIGLEIPDGTGLSNFNWTINGQPLVCNLKVSNTHCFDDHQSNTNFFPIVGNVGDTFNITVTANRIDSLVSTERSVTISRTFKIVQPSVSIVSNDQVNAWPKTLGQYVDTSGATFNEYSQDTLETLGGNTVTLRALLTPDFLGAIAPPQVERSWMVDGIAVGDGATNTVSFSANKPGKSVYNVSLSAVYRPSALTRQAMEDIWGLSALDTTESYFGNSIQVEHPDASVLATSGAKKYYALIASYLPSSVLFSLKVLFSIGLIFFASGVVFALIPNMTDPALSRSRRNVE